MQKYFISYFWRDFDKTGFGDFETELYKFDKEVIREEIKEALNVEDVAILFIKEIDDGSVN